MTTLPLPPQSEPPAEPATGLKEPVTVGVYETLDKREATVIDVFDGVAYGWMTGPKGRLFHSWSLDGGASLGFVQGANLTRRISDLPLSPREILARDALALAKGWIRDNHIDHEAVDEALSALAALKGGGAFKESPLEKREPDLAEIDRLFHTARPQWAALRRAAEKVILGVHIHNQRLREGSPAHEISGPVWNDLSKALFLVKNPDACVTCRGTGMTEGWRPSYRNPDNEGFEIPAQPCPDCDGKGGRK